jgi:hypothetical protein
MNWGKGIAIFLTIFVLFILGMVYMTTRSTFDLEAEDYYAQEISYQDRIDALALGSDYKEFFHVESATDNVVISLDKELADVMKDGKVSFYRPNDSSLDRSFDLLIENGVSVFSKEGFVRGKYEVRVEWMVDGKKHALVEDLTVL